MRARILIAAAIAAVTTAMTVGPAVPAAAPLGARPAARHHVDRAPVPPMHMATVSKIHTMCGGDMV